MADLSGDGGGGTGSGGGGTALDDGWSSGVAVDHEQSSDGGGWVPPNPASGLTQLGSQGSPTLYDLELLDGGPQRLIVRFTTSSTAASVAPP